MAEVEYDDWTGNVIFTTYEYNPVLNEGTSTTNRDHEFETVDEALASEFGSRTIMTLDQLGLNSQQYTAHLKAPGWTIGRIDGSAAFRIDQEAYDSLNSGGTAYNFQNHYDIIQKWLED